MIAALGAGMDIAGPPPRIAGSGKSRRHIPKMDTVLQREIAEHNAAVVRRKAEKTARKRDR